MSINLWYSAILREREKKNRRVFFLTEMVVNGCWLLECHDHRFNLFDPQIFFVLNRGSLWPSLKTSVGNTDPDEKWRFHIPRPKQQVYQHVQCWGPLLAGCHVMTLLSLALFSLGSSEFENVGYWLFYVYVAADLTVFFGLVSPSYDLQNTA